MILECFSRKLLISVPEDVDPDLFLWRGVLLAIVTSMLLLLCSFVEVVVVDGGGANMFDVAKMSPGQPPSRKDESSRFFINGEYGT